MSRGSKAFAYCLLQRVYKGQLYDLGPMLMVMCCSYGVKDGGCGLLGTVQA